MSVAFATVSAVSSVGTREERPDDSEYYVTRTDLLSQGDVFADVPLAYPMPPGDILEDSERFGGVRRFLSGSLDYGRAVLVTPTCTMRAQGVNGGGDYSHPVRTLVPLVPLDDALKGALELDPGRLGLLRKYDELISYMFFPAEPGLDLPESLAFLYMPITLHHDMVVDQRVTRLAMEGARQLHRKLVWFYTGVRPLRAAFIPPMD